MALTRRVRREPVARDDDDEQAISWAVYGPAGVVTLSAIRLVDATRNDWARGTVTCTAGPDFRAGIELAPSDTEPVWQHAERMGFHDESVWAALTDLYERVFPGGDR